MESERTRLHQELRDRSIQIGGTLRLGVMGTSTPFTSVFTIPFLRRFPDVNLRVITGTPFVIQQGIEELTHDVAITFLEDKPQRYLRSQELYTQQYYIFAARSSRFAGRSSVEWKELKEVPLCLYPAETQVFGSEVYEMLDARAAGVPRMETNNMFVLVDHVRTGNWLPNT